MIPNFSLENYNKATEASSSSPKLTPGAYLCTILDARISNETSGQYLKVAIDIAEGEFTGYFMKKFKQRYELDPNSRYPGSAVYSIPLSYSWGMDRYNKLCKAVADSNSSYKPSGDETQLKGKVVGAVFGEETSITQEHLVITYTKVKNLISVSQVREGKFTIPEPSETKAYREYKESISKSDSSSDEEYPF